MRTTSNNMFIYALRHPDTKDAFYVGQSKDVYIRLLNHIQKSHLLKSEKDKVITEICKSGRLPEYEILETLTCDVYDKKFGSLVYEREIYWIKILNKNDQLKNIQKVKSKAATQEVAKRLNSVGSKSCINCGDGFTPKNPKGIYCSDRCRVAGNRKKMGAKGITRKAVIVDEVIKFKSATKKSLDGSKKRMVEMDEVGKIDTPQTPLKIKRYDYSKMPKGLNYFQQLKWKEGVRNEQDKK